MATLTIESLYTDEIREIIGEAVDQLKKDLHDAMPASAELVSNWMEELSKSGAASDRLTAPDMFPVLLLPFWIAEKSTSDLDLEFTRAILYSSISAYYYVRLVDNVMDSEYTIEPIILPVSSFFSGQSFRRLLQIFPSDHPFWIHCYKHWYDSADFAIADASSADIDRVAFVGIASKKICAAKIPIAASAFWYDLASEIPVWNRFCDLLGCYHQMFDDLSDFLADEKHEARSSYLISEARRRKEPDEDSFFWFIREGFDWSLNELKSYLIKMRLLSAEMESSALTEYIASKELRMDAWRNRVAHSVRATSKLSDSSP